MGSLHPFSDNDGDTHMRKMLKKLKSDSGASLMMALLLFLVCSVIGSAVLVAGTAASGRMAKIADKDELYYSVNSAANLLIELLDGKSVKAVTVSNSDGSDAPNPVFYEKGEDGTYTKAASVNTLPLDVINRIVSAGSFTEPISPKVTFSAPGSAEVEGKLKEVTITEEIYPDGRLVLVVSREDIKNNYSYDIQLTFAGEKHESQSKKIDGDRTITTTETSITWKLSDVK